MMPIELTCEACGVLKTPTLREAEGFVAALREGDGERLRCLTCGMSLSRPLQRALDLPSPPVHPSSEGVVVWNAGGPAAGKSSIAHGIRFTSPVTEGFAVELFLSESFPRQG